jgi:hypothetical protein
MCGIENCNRNVCFHDMFPDYDRYLEFWKFTILVAGMFPVFASSAAMELEHFQGWTE